MQNKYMNNMNNRRGIYRPDGSTGDEGSPVSALYERDYNATSSPPFSPVETSDHTISSYISDGFFSHVALCCNGTSTHENTHGKLFEDISHSLLSFLFFFFFCHFPITALLENLLEFSTLHAKVSFNNI